MALPVRFIESVSFNTADPIPATGLVGGATGAAPTVILETLDYVFPANVSDFIGQPDRHRFQKIYIDNTGETAGEVITNAKFFFNNVKFPDQISFAFEKIAGDTGHGTGYPQGYSTSDFSTPLGIVNAILITGATATGDLNTGEFIGIWLHQQIPQNLPAETGAIATIGLVGELP